MARQVTNTRAMPRSPAPKRHAAVDRRKFCPVCDPPVTRSHIGREPRGLALGVPVSLAPLLKVLAGRCPSPRGLAITPDPEIPSRRPGDGVASGLHAAVKRHSHPAVPDRLMGSPGQPRAAARWIFRTRTDREWRDALRRRP